MPSDVVLKFRDLISKLEKDVEAVVKLEREERELAASEAKVGTTRIHQQLQAAPQKRCHIERLCPCVQLSVAQKKLDGSTSTQSQRVWFQTQQERKQSRGEWNQTMTRGLPGTFHVLQHCVSFCSVSKALQEFDLALRGKRKREKFLKDSKRKKELTVTRILSISWSSLKSFAE